MKLTAVRYLMNIYDLCNEYEEFISNEDWDEALKIEKNQMKKIWMLLTMDNHCSTEENEKLFEKYYYDTF